MTETVDFRAFALPVFAILILVEVFYSAWRRQQAYALHDFLGSMSQMAGNIVVSLLTRGAILGFYFWLHQYRPFTIGTDLISLLGLAVAIDFVFYWYHRASHRIRILWAVHVAHHSSEHMNLGTALRQPWFGPLTKPIFYWPLPLIGFDPLAVMAVGSLLTVYGFWTHTEQIKRIGILEQIFVSPAHHRVHHGSNPIYIDKNYSNFLIIWDKMFGTFQDEVEPVRYGITTNINSYNPLVITFHEWRAVVRDAMSARSLTRFRQAILGTPEQAALFTHVGNTQIDSRTQSDQSTNPLS